jgi:large subunit ribosomal protein L28
MARVCDICGKKVLSGHSVSHSHRKTKRKWKPNLQKKKILIDGELKEVKICTRCLRSMEKTR